MAEYFDWATKLNELPQDCLFHIFEFFPLDFLCCIKSDFDRLNDALNAYIQHRYKLKILCVKKYRNQIQLYPNEPSVRKILDSIGRVDIFGIESDLFRFVAKNCPNLRMISISTLLPSRSSENKLNLDESIKKTIEMVEILKFRVTCFDGNGDSILKHAKNMKELRIISKTSKSNSRNRNADNRNGWCSLTHPKLETIQWDDGIVNHPNELRQLFKRNPGIKNLIAERNIQVTLEFIKELELNFDKLNLRFGTKEVNSFENVKGNLIHLLDNGRINKLQITFDNSRIIDEHINSLESITQLEAVTLNGSYTSSIERLQHLTELSMDTLEDGTSAAQRLTIRRLRVTRCSIDAIRPFISNSPNLIGIQIEQVKLEPLDSIDTLIRDRELLPGAKVLKIFLEEWAYLQPKIVEIRRAESFPVQY